MSGTKKPIHALPLPTRTLQSSLHPLELDTTPVAQRRSTTFNPATRGIWARVNPLWAAWPLRITKEELLEMGVDVDKGQQVSVDDVLKRWDVVVEGQGDGVGLGVGSSEHRLKLEPKLLGISSATLRDSLPHLDVGDAEALCGLESLPNTKTNESRDALIDIISGRKIIQSSDGKYGPWSTRYCGHQFGHWAGQLGDGRAISLLETESPEGGRQEIQLKGAGRTPFSRTADGLAVLRSGVREFLGCEAVAALDIPTTRSLALLTEPSISVLRENGPEQPSLLARVAPSFIRIGHFEALNPGKAGHNHHQFFLGGQGGGWMHDEGDDKSEDKGPLGGQGNLEGLRELTEWCQYVLGSQGGVEGWVREVIRRNAEMVAGWQVYGWMHGVLNTDNISVLGLTIDYGPFAFMDVWDEQHICNHSDPSGLYSYKAQPSRVLWSLDKLVTAVSPLIGYESINGASSLKEGFSGGATSSDVDEWSKKGMEVMAGFEEEFYRVEREAEKKGWMKRFGLKTFTNQDNRDMISDYLTHLHTHRIDLHTSLRHLSILRPTSSPDSIKSFTEKMLRASIPLPTDEKISDALKDFVPYFKNYCERVSSEQEKTAWTESHVEKDVKGVVLEGEGWEDKRQVEMLRVNPKFILRQWVLEELIGKLESTGTDRIEEGRRELARVLDMSTRPFIKWEEVGPEEKRLCGLGSKDMLGFQCSCSS